VAILPRKNAYFFVLFCASIVFYRLFLKYCQVIATNGGDDPWRGCTLNATLSSTYPETTAWCSGCGHCGDLHEPDPVNDPPELTAQRSLIQQ
jgi:hypothetical protein